MGIPMFRILLQLLARHLGITSEDDPIERVERDERGREHNPGHPVDPPGHPVIVAAAAPLGRAENGPHLLPVFPVVRLGLPRTRTGLIFFFFFFFRACLALAFTSRQHLVHHAELEQAQEHKASAEVHEDVDGL